MRTRKRQWFGNGKVFQREDELGWHLCANTKPEGSVYSRGKDLVHLASQRLGGSNEISPQLKSLV